MPPCQIWRGSPLASQNMKKVGNVTSNKIYNPENKKPPVPVDADEADSAMERFIRSKYVTPPTSTKDRNTRVLDEGTPPPLPPKTPSKFSFRNASSILPLGSRSKKEARNNTLPSPRDFPRSPSPESHLQNKPSKVFGASVQYDTSDDTEKKLTTLRDMGFADGSRNLAILKGVNGSLERAIETLVRLGEGDRRSPGFTSNGAHTLRTSRSLTPMTPSSTSMSQQATFEGQVHTPSSVSHNPFDLLPPAQPQTAQSTGTIQNKNPFYATAAATNPFGVPLQQQDINQAFGNLSLAPPQPLFPNHTGGVPGVQMGAPLSGYMQQQQQQTTTPSMPQGYAPMSMKFNSNMTYPQPMQPMQPQPTGNNPFLTNQLQQLQPQQQPQQQAQQTLAVNTVSNSPTAMTNNPFTRSPTRIQSPPLGQIPEQTQSNFYSSPQPLSPSAGNPFFTQQQQQQQQLQQTMTWPQQNQFSNPYQTQNPYQQNPYQPAAAPAQQFQPQRADKASILALYNQTGFAAQPSTEQSQQPASPVTQPAQPAMQASQPQQVHRSVSTPLPSANNNPFFQNGAGGGAPVAAPAAQAGMAAHQHQHQEQQQQQQQQKTHASRESMAFSDMNWANGRHSPDAFASLSSRHM